MRTHYTFRWLLPLLCGVLLASTCDHTLIRRAAITGYLSDPLTATLPPAFLVGVPDTVVVHSFGNSCVGFGRTDLSIDGLLAIVEPYDIVEGTACYDILVQIPHTVELVFEVAGQATLQFIGLDLRDSLVTIETTVPVNQP